MTAQVPLGLTARMRHSANAKKAARSEGEGKEATARILKKLVKAGIQSTASPNSEGVEGFPLSLGLCCPSTFSPTV